MPSLEIYIPYKIPVMTLGGTVLFPRTFMPIYIFERRYRRMLADALSSHRVFIIANRADGKTKYIEHDSAPCSIATIGIIRMSTLNDDGTSNVILQGLNRIRIKDITQEKPYRMATISEIPNDLDQPSKDQGMRQKKLLDIIKTRQAIGLPSPDGILDLIDSLDNLDSIADLAAHSLSKGAALKQRVLETFDTNKRMDLLIKSLSQDIEHKKLDLAIEALVGQDKEPLN